MVGNKHRYKKNYRKVLLEPDGHRLQLYTIQSMTVDIRILHGYFLAFPFTNVAWWHDGSKVQVSAVPLLVNLRQVIHTHASVTMQYKQVPVRVQRMTNGWEGKYRLGITLVMCVLTYMVYPPKNSID